MMSMRALRKPGLACWTMLAGLLICAPSLRAVEPRDLMLSVQGLYAHPLSPQHYKDSYGGAGLDLSLERVFEDRYSLGFALTQVNFRKNYGDPASFASIDLVGRVFFGEWKGLNPYLQLGAGGNFFRDSYKDPFGDVLHVQVRAGSQYVMNDCWSLDYGVGYHMVAPVTAPYQYADVRVGLNYRFGTQPKANLNRPPDVVARQLDIIENPRYEPAAPLAADEYRVAKGDCLYRIAGGSASLDGDPRLWPLLYWQNKDEVKNPHWIFPGQVIKVRKQYTKGEREKALRECSVSGMVVKSVTAQ